MTERYTLADYTESEFEYGPWTRSVYKKGSGPAAIIIHEMPGLHPQVIRFADRVADAGMTVYVPSLFGKPERGITNGYAAATMLHGIWWVQLACVSPVALRWQ